MTNSQIKNLGFSIFMSIVVLYVLLFNFSWVSLAGVVIFTASMFLSSILSDKDNGIVAKLDIYVLFTVLALLSTQFEALASAFGSEITGSPMSENTAWRTLVLIIGIIVGLVMNSKSRGKKTNQAKTIMKYIGLFLVFESITFFLFGDATGLFQNVCIFTFFGIIKYLKLQLYLTSSESSARCEWVAVCISFIVILLNFLFGAYSITDLNLKGFISTIVFPWYNVLGITLICLAIGGAYIHFAKKENAFFDEDILFLSGLVGFIWVLKSSLYFYFDFHWIAICIYVCLFLALFQRFINKRGGRKKVSLYDSLRKIKENEVYMTLITAVAIALAIYMTNIGYVFFWLSILICTIATCFVHRNFNTWIKDAVFWQTVLLGIATTGGLFTLQNGYSEKKIIIIIAMFIVTSIIMWMLNYKNQIGNNKFKGTKIAVSVVLGILVFTSMGKAGTHIDVAYTNSKANGGSYIKADTMLSISTRANGEDNHITELKYTWADSFIVDEDSAIVVDELGMEFEIEIRNHHLVLWATDSNGVITRKDCWFYRAP